MSSPQSEPSGNWGLTEVVTSSSTGLGKRTRGCKSPYSGEPGQDLVPWGPPGESFSGPDAEAHPGRRRRLSGRRPSVVRSPPPSTSPPGPSPCTEEVRCVFGLGALAPEPGCWRRRRGTGRRGGGPRVRGGSRLRCGGRSSVREKGVRRKSGVTGDEDVPSRREGCRTTLGAKRPRPTQIENLTHPTPLGTGVPNNRTTEKPLTHHEQKTLQNRIAPTPNTTLRTGTPILPSPLQKESGPHRFGLCDFSARSTDRLVSLHKVLAPVAGTYSRRRAHVVLVWCVQRPGVARTISLRPRSWAADVSKIREPTKLRVCVTLKTRPPL